MRKILSGYKKYFLVLLFLLLLVICFLEIKTVKSEIENPKPSILLDKEGKPLIKMASKKLTLKQLPPLIQKYINSEKAYNDLPNILFSQHPIKRVISQVLVKNIYSKGEIESFYINSLYFHPGILGLQSSSNYYLNKSINDLTPLECIFLLSKNKVTDQDTKRNAIKLIEGFYEKKLITYKERKEYINHLPDLIDSLYGKDTYAQSYSQLVIKEIKNKLDMNEEEFSRKGYRVYTAMDRDIQKDLYNKFIHADVFSESKMQAIIEAGTVIINHHNGEVSGLMGGRKYQATTLNHAFEVKRQPASTYKPLIVYGPAIDHGWKSNDILRDIPIVAGNFRPKNYDYKFRNKVTLKEAISESYNVPAVWLLSKIGLETGMKYIGKFHLFADNTQDGYALALGYTSIGTSPLAMAQAYSVFPNQGNMVDVHSIIEVKNANGRSVYKFKAKEVEIFKKSTAKKMSALLKNVIDNGTGEKAKIPGQFLAGKTGTTSYDAWFVGFNKKYVGAIWMGPDEVIPRNRMDIGGGETPSTLFKKIFVDLK